MRRLLPGAGEGGSAAVEFALLLPVLTLLLFGIMVFGIYFNSYLSVSHAAKEGARWASLRSTATEVQAKAEESSPGIDWAQATVEMTGVPSDGATDADQGNPVTVTVTYQLPEAVIELRNSLNAVAALFGPGVLLPGEIRGEATQRVE